MNGKMANETCVWPLAAIPNESGSINLWHSRDRLVGRYNYPEGNYGNKKHFHGDKQLDAIWLIIT